MQRRIRTYLGVLYSSGKHCPRILIALLLILAFGITHGLALLAMQIRHDQTQEKLAACGYSLELQPPEQVKFPVTRPSVSADGLDPLIVESLNKPNSNWVRYFYEPNLSMAPAELLSRYQSVYEEQQVALLLLHNIRIHDPELFARYAQAFDMSLAAIYFISSRHCMEVGDTIASANLLGDLLQLRKVLASPPTPVSLFSFTSFYDSIQKLGARLKHNDPAKPIIERLVKELLDDSTYQYAFVDQASIHLILYDHDTSPYPLLEPFKKRQYTRLAEVSMNRLRQFKAGHCEDYDFTRELQSLPFFFKNPSILLYENYGSKLTERIAYPKNSAKHFDPKAVFTLLSNAQNILDEPETNHLSAVALACQLYRIDHDAWPADLAHLSPGYLPLPPQRYASADDKLVLYRIKYQSGNVREALVSVRYPFNTINRRMPPNVFDVLQPLQIDLIPTTITDIYNTPSASIEALTPP